MKKIVLIFIVVLLFSCSARNLDYLKSNAKEFFDERGFKIVGYEGSLYGFDTFIGKYGGACAWYIIQRKDFNDGFIYHCYLKSWGDEIHLYDLQVINYKTIDEK